MRIKASPMVANGIAAIPTKYKGVQFRSRLEAKWACFFDLYGWPWEYEPFDAVGYIPDFVINGTVVEVKPFPELPYGIHYSDEWEICLRKIRSSGINNAVVIVGSKIHHYPSIYGESEECIPWDCAIIGMFQEECESNFEPFHTHSYKNVIEMWKEAANIVQWKGGK